MRPEAFEAYRHALRLGQRESHALISRGQNPYPAVLDEELGAQAGLREEAAGVFDIPVTRIAGVKSGARQSAFSASFYPLLGEHTEFANKWIALYDAHLSSGIRDAVEVIEYLGGYYISEGNKRVSVLKHAGARHISARVTRLLPERDGSIEAERYYEYLAFARSSGISDLYFAEQGRFSRLLKALGKAADAPFSEEERKKLRAQIARFRAAFELGARGADVTRFSETFLAFTEICGVEAVDASSIDEIAENVDKLRAEVEAMARPERLKLSLDPTPLSKAPLIKKLLPSSDDISCAFLYERTPETSPWTASHELGRQKLLRHFGSRVQADTIENVRPGENDFEAISRAVEAGASVVFTTTPKMIGASVRAALAYPDVKILNCSMNMRHPLVRTYYGRLYEAKFIVGAVAGALCQNETIGYLADYPIYGVPAGINAFAKGAQMTNPRAKIHLEWTCKKGADPVRAFADAGVTLISGRDLRTLSENAQNFGLYRQHASGAEWLALPFWRWGRLYIGIIESILSGTWKAEDASGGRAVNYWWGLSSNVIDVLASARLPAGTRRMMELLKSAVKRNELNPLAPFYEPGAADTNLPAPAGAMMENTLAENVIGSIPAFDDLIEEAKPLVLLQGLSREGA